MLTSSRSPTSTIVNCNWEPRRTIEPRPSETKAQQQERRNRNNRKKATVEKDVTRCVHPSFQFVLAAAVASRTRTRNRNRNRMPSATNSTEQFHRFIADQSKQLNYSVAPSIIQVLFRIPWPFSTIRCHSLALSDAPFLLRFSTTSLRLLALLLFQCLRIVFDPLQRSLAGSFKTRWRSAAMADYFPGTIKDLLCLFALRLAIYLWKITFRLFNFALIVSDLLLKAFRRWCFLR